MKWVRYSIKRVTKKWMRIAKRKCFWWSRRMVGGCAGTWWGCGKLPRFRIFKI
jgi:hypothetical protein